MIQLGYRIGRCRRTVHVLARRWRYPVCHRHMRQSSVRCCPCLCAQRNICRYRIQAGLEDTSPWVFIVLQRSGIGISHVPCKCIYLSDVITELRNLVDQLLKPFSVGLDLRRLGCRDHGFQDGSNLRFSYVLTGSPHLVGHICRNSGNVLGIKPLAVIGHQSGLHFLHSYLLFIVDQLLHCIQGIRHVGNPEALWTGEVVDSAAFLHGLAAVHAVVYHGR